MESHGIEISPRNRYMYRLYGRVQMVNPNIPDQLHKLIMDLEMKNIFAEDVVTISPVQ